MGYCRKEEGKIQRKDDEVGLLLSNYRISGPLHSAALTFAFFEFSVDAK